MVCTAKAWDTNVGICVLPEVIEQKEETTSPDTQETDLPPARVKLIMRKQEIKNQLLLAAPPSNDDIEEIEHAVAPPPPKPESIDDPVNENLFISIIDTIILNPIKTIWNWMDEMSLKILK